MNSEIYSLVNSLAQILVANEIVVTTAESCTGGGISAALTDIPGSSQYFHAGFVVYSNQMKEALLGVPPTTLANYGAVSEAVASCMLEGALVRSSANLGVATTGIAGPGGATSTKPVGTVCFAVGTIEKRILRTCYFDGDRESIRQQAVIQALKMLIESTA